MHPVFRSVFIFGVASASTLAPWSADAAERKSVVTSVVSASIDKEYRRAKSREGGFKPEYYALSFGGQAHGTISHRSIDQVARPDFERLVKEQLAKQQYLLARDTASASLLIHLLWGMTDPPTSSTSLDIARDTAASSLSAARASGVAPTGGFGVPSLTPEQQAAASDAESALMTMFMLERNHARALVPSASVIGYIDTVNGLSDSPAIHAGLGTLYNDLWYEINERRYYVIVYAYDFKVLQQSKKLKPLWVTRVSIAAKGNQFDEHLATMVARASGYFGRPSHGLSRRLEGRVEIGEAEVMGVVGDDPAETASPPVRPTELEDSRTSEHDGTPSKP